jgi:hypothetical protein
MKRTAAALILPLALVVTTPLHPVASQAPKPLARIPFELAGRHILLKATVNKSRPLSFVLDTGANLALVRSDTAKELGLSLTGNANAMGAGAGQQAGQLVRGARWSLIGLENFSQPVELSFPFPGLPSGLGQNVDGIVGGQFIKEFVVELDYQARIMTLHDRGKFTYSGKGTTLPLEFNSDYHPVLKATVTPLGGKPIEQTFTLDTGSGGALILHSPFVNQHQLLAEESKTIPAIGGVGAGGRTVGRVGRVASLQIGPYTFKNVTTTFSQDQAGAFANSSLAGNIGAQIARRFRVFLDYGRKRIILEPSPIFDDPFEGPTTGLSVRAEGANYRTFVVRVVLEDSPATEAGLRVGDVITSVNGVAAEKFTLPLLLEAIQKPGTHAIAIRRGDQNITLTLKSRPLV